MSGNILGGAKAAATNKALYGDDFYKVIGRKGGKLGRTGGFGNGDAGKKLAAIAGAKGGRISRKSSQKVYYSLATQTPPQSKRHGF